MGDRLSRGAESASIRAFGAFRDYWRESPDYPAENRNNDHVHFPVDVHYEWAAGRSSLDFSTELRAFVGAGPEDGRIDLEDTSKVRIEDFHLSFRPVFQKYTYNDAEKTLIITGNSQKMRGEYRVVVRPDLEEP